MASAHQCAQSLTAAHLGASKSVALGCHVAGGGVCTTMQRDLFDSNRPIYTVNAATMQVRRVANATCALARSTLP